MIFCSEFHSYLQNLTDKVEFERVGFVLIFNFYGTYHFSNERIILYTLTSMNWFQQINHINIEYNPYFYSLFEADVELRETILKVWPYTAKEKIELLVPTTRGK